MKFCAAFIAMLFVAPCGISQITTLKSQVVQQDIVFIYAAGPDGLVDKNKPLGTGFFLMIPQKSSDSYYLFLITARHIVDPQWAYCGTPNPQKIFYRINKKSYDPNHDVEGVDYVELSLMNGSNRTFAIHPNDDVDAALIPIAPAAFNPMNYDVTALRMNLLASADEVTELGIGDLVASAGLLPGASGSKRNYPLFKFGYVSALPQENIDSTCVPGGQPRSLRLWLVAANLFPGASGSPVLYIPSIFGSSDRKAINRGVLIGVQSMSFVLADVAGVTPISYVGDIIDNMHLPDANLYRGNVPEPPAVTPSKPKR